MRPPNPSWSLFFLMYVAIPVLFSRPRRRAGRAPPGHHAGLRRAADQLWSAGRPGARLRLRIGLERARPGCFLPAAGAHAVVAPRRGPTPAGRGVSCPRRGFRDAGHPARLRRALDLGGVGHRGGGDASGSACASSGCRRGCSASCCSSLPVSSTCTTCVRRGRLAGAQQCLPRRPAAGAGRAVLRLAVAAASAGTAPGGALAGATCCWSGASLWWAGGGLHEIDRHRAPLCRATRRWCFSRSRACFSAGSSAAPELAAGALPGARLAAADGLAGAAACLPCCASWRAFRLPRLATGFAAHLLLLHRHEAAGDACLKWLHAAGLWLLAAIAAWELAWAIDWWVAGEPPGR
jgi:hypothetical protein